MRLKTDTELLATLQGDPEAFETFYRRNVDAVTKFAARRCQTSSDVADIVSGTFLAVRHGADGFDSRRGTPRAWLLGVAAHQVSASHRANDRQQSMARRIAGHALLDEDDHARLEARIAAEQIAPSVATALQGAPESEREVFLLVAYEGLTPSEAAHVLHISAVAARVRLVRVRRRLRRAIDAPSVNNTGTDQTMETTT